MKTKLYIIIIVCVGVLALWLLLRPVPTSPLQIDSDQVSDDTSPEPDNDQTNDSVDDTPLITDPSIPQDDNETVIPDPSPLAGTEWKWQKTIGNQIITPKRDSFVITFNADNSMGSTTDCNHMGGSYKTSGTEIQFGDMFTTLMYCEDSQEQIYSAQLGQVESFKIEGDMLSLYLSNNSSVMVFKAVK